VLDEVLKLSDVSEYPSEELDEESMLELEELDDELNSKQDRINVFGQGSKVPS
jgi:hypothetical protein